MADAGRSRHCVAVSLPAPERLVWHKLYASVARVGYPEKAQKDLIQAATLAAILAEQDDCQLGDALADAPAGLVVAARTRLPSLHKLLAAHPQALDQLTAALTG